MPQPLAFDGSSGWYHPASGDLAVVLCGPHGHEALCVHRHWRELAEALAEAGLPTLRFDYPGTGDAVDDDQAPGRVEAWIDSIGAAMRTVRRISGADRVALIGLRMGAILAATAAARVGGVEALVLLAPHNSGEACVRELRALAMMAARHSSAGAPRSDGDLEAAGFVYTKDTLDSLRRLKLFAPGAPPAKKILIFNRPSAAQNQNVRPEWVGSSATVEVNISDEFPLLLRDAEASIYPEGCFGQVIAWLAAQRGVTRERAPSTPPAAVLRLPGAEESAVFYARDPDLFGVWCTPLRQTAMPVLVFLNTGRNHHIGTSRLTVSLARRLAESGFASLRLDIGGVGDSDAPRDRHPFDPAAVPDVRRALDWLEQHGQRDAILIGLCAGAKLALETAWVDDRVVGQILLNMQGVWQAADPADMFLSRRAYFRLAGRLENWSRLVRGEVNVWGILKAIARRSVAACRTELQAAWHRINRQPSARSEALNQFRTLLRRRVKTSLIYVNDDPGVDELQVMFGSDGHSLANVPNVSITFLKEGDHMFSSRESRRPLLRLIEQELARMTSPSVAAPLPASPARRCAVAAAPDSLLVG